MMNHAPLSSSKTSAPPIFAPPPLLLSDQSLIIKLFTDHNKSDQNEMKPKIISIDHNKTVNKPP